MAINIYKETLRTWFKFGSVSMCLERAVDIKVF